MYIHTYMSTQLEYACMVTCVNFFARTRKRDGTNGEGENRLMDRLERHSGNLLSKCILYICARSGVDCNLVLWVLWNCHLLFALVRTSETVAASAESVNPLLIRNCKGDNRTAGKNAGFFLPFWLGKTKCVSLRRDIRGGFKKHFWLPAINELYAFNSNTVILLPRPYIWA